jgi:TonB family protein
VSGKAGSAYLLAGLTIAASSPSFALPPPADEVETGIELYWSGQYRETVALLSSLCDAESREDSAVECYKYLAFSHVALGEAEMAQRAFSRLLARDAEYQLDESLVSPKILEQFQASRRKLIAELFDKGKKAYFGEDYSNAAELFAKVLRLDPENVLAKEYSQLSSERSALEEKQASLAKQVAAPAPAPAPAPPAPAPEEADDRVYHLTSRMTPPVLVESVRPDYPSAERRARREGTVMVSAVIGKDGVPREVKVIRSVSPGLSDAAIQAVLKWRYRPARLEDRTVAVYTVIRLVFDLE